MLEQMNKVDCRVDAILKIVDKHHNIVPNLSRNKYYKNQVTELSIENICFDG